MISKSLCCLLCLPMVSCSSDRDQTPAAGGSPKVHLAMVPKGTTHVFWKSVEAGARGAATELGVELTWKGPVVESDRSQQIQLVQQFLTQGVDGLLLAPLDDKALVAPVADAAARKVPVVIFDSPLAGEPGKDFVSLVATDNRQAGNAGGQHLRQLLGGRGNVVLLRYMVASASTEAREAGFLAAMVGDGLAVTVDKRYGGATAGEAKTTALNMLDEIRAAQGVFCSNESTTVGMWLALKQEGLLGKVRLVGFDASPPLVAALKAGEIDALVVQNPRKMGDLAVRTMVAHLRHEAVPAQIDTGAVVVTRTNMDSAEIAPLLR